MAPFFSINIAWGKFQERDASFRLMLNRKASLRMVCSAQHHQITIFKQQIRGVGRTFHRGEGEAFLRQFLSRATNQDFCYTHQCFMYGILQRGIKELFLVIVNDFLNNC